MNHLDKWDIVGILACWCGAAAVAYFSDDMVVALISAGAAYYLSRLIILKSE